MRTWTLLALLSGCGGAAMYGGAPAAEADYGAEEAGYGGADLQAAPPMAAPSSAHSPQAALQPVVDADGQPAEGTGPSGPLRLIYRAELAMRVDHGESTATLDGMLAATLAAGGYLSRRDAGLLVLRVPSAQFHPIVAQLETFGDVTQRRVQVQDVSEEFHDLEVRIESMTALLERMRGLLERATTLDEILRIEGEIGRITTTIDAARGRLRFLRSHVAWSTVSVSVSEGAAPVVVDEPPPVSPTTRTLPIEWLNRTGLQNLLDLEND
ncbi:MAG: DUF4349 domain-containing protein [Myxococcota bacterium]